MNKDAAELPFHNRHDPRPRPVPGAPLRRHNFLPDLGQIKLKMFGQLDVLDAMSPYTQPIRFRIDADKYKKNTQYNVVYVNQLNKPRVEPATFESQSGLKVVLTPASRTATRRSTASPSPSSPTRRGHSPMSSRSTASPSGDGHDLGQLAGRDGSAPRRVDNGSDSLTEARSRRTPRTLFSLYKYSTNPLVGQHEYMSGTARALILPEPKRPRLNPGLGSPASGRLFHPLGSAVGLADL